MSVSKKSMLLRAQLLVDGCSGTLMSLFLFVSFLFGFVNVVCFQPCLRLMSECEIDDTVSFSTIEFVWRDGLCYMSLRCFMAEMRLHGMICITANDFGPNTCRGWCDCIWQWLKSNRCLAETTVV